ncbi:hypothetical protein B0T19DRAFT_445658 [Cercophora scortea]|uniref:Uncharacterized protein n=1 Tax=Cercophora scortea TaxID=314031 RepID=A0AAE0I7H7_9PEZI|nr:hypothetical protein B0T19DRAFT_445658 [Cercophora scortea]
MSTQSTSSWPGSQPETQQSAGISSSPGSDEEMETFSQGSDDGSDEEEDEEGEEEEDDEEGDDDDDDDEEEEEDEEGDEDDDDDHDDDDDNNSYCSTDPNSNPRYTPEELTAIVLDFYTFTKLHFKPSDLKLPPPGGWPNLTRENVGPNFKSDYTLSVLRQLPCLNKEGLIEYNCQVQDYSTRTRESFEPDEYGHLHGEDLYTDDDGNPDAPVHDHIVSFAPGYSSGGIELMLNVHAGTIGAVMIRYSDIGEEDIQRYFDSVKKKFRKLRLLPCMGKQTLDAEKVPERSRGIRLEAVRNQIRADDRIFTHLDLQYIRQVYRDYGWPRAFRREEFEANIDRVLVEMGAEPDWWEDTRAL